MRIFFPIIAAGVIIVLFGSIEILLLRRLNPIWWHKRLVRTAALALPVAGLVTIVLWSLGEYHKIEWLALPGAVTTALVFLMEVSLMATLPVSGAIHFINRRMDHRAARKQSDEAAPISNGRRLFLQGAAAAVPLMTLAGSARGLQRAFSPVRVYVRPIPMPTLPESLEGFRILHLSDIHLWHYTNLETVGQILEDARPLKPDLILVTGDIADDLRLLSPALTMMREFGAPHGVYGSLGNHEHFRGIPEVLQAFERAEVPLLVNSGVSLAISGVRVYVAGVDDPVRMGVRHDEFYRERVDEALRDVSGADLILLMSHRPNVFDTAAQRGVHLTLSGHTHGGQIGFMGRSVFESYGGDFYLWGEYENGASRLYTSCGAGHWFPFRLGCPTEAPVIELNRVMSAVRQSA